MDIKKYDHYFDITFRDVDISEHLTMNALVDFMQEAARKHAILLGLNYSQIDDEYYWIIMRTKMQLDTPPKVGERIRIETFIEGLDHLCSVRRFNIYNDKDEQIGYIIGYYLLMSKETHGPVRLKLLEDKKDIFGITYEKEKLQKLKNTLATNIYTTNRCAYSSDIDSNNHMNNAHYIRWIVDTFSTEELKDHRITTLRIQYVQEICEGEEVEIVRGKNTEGEDCIIGKNDDGTLHFIGKVERK